jgi:glyoxalase family protein
MNMQLAGYHHLTAVTADAARTHRFYTETLGMRLVKKTVNQDDVSAYHLFYGDGRASPGSDITFFEWPVQLERRGTSSVIRTGLRVSGAHALDWWAERFTDRNVAHSPVVLRCGRLTLDFEDPEGQRLCLVDESEEGMAYPWEESPVPSARQIRGLGPITLSVPDGEATGRILTGLLNMSNSRTYPLGEGEGTIQVYEMGVGGCARELHLQQEARLSRARLGAGGVHHLALRAPGVDDYDRWLVRLEDMGIASSGPVDRHYFKSLYFRDPSGILFEIATDEPGFAVDEPLEKLGQTLSLPPFLAPRRREIEAGLKPL